MSDTDWVNLDDAVGEVLLASKNGATAPDEPTDTWAPQNLNDLPEHPPTPPNLGNTHLVYPGKRHVFSGPPESAKTLAAYCILIQVVRMGGKAILIDFEMGGYDARQRLRELGATPDEIDRIAYIEPDERANVDRIANLIDLQPDLVVIDAAAGIYSLEGLDDNKRGDVEKISALYIRAFWRNSIATILLDHVVKDGEARGRFAIGSERKLGGADVHMGFDTISPISRGSSGKYKISTHKDRGGYLKRGHLADLQLDSDPDTHNITWAFTEAVLTTDSQGHKRFTINMERISKLLEGMTQPMGVGEVKRELGGKSEYVSKAVTSLVDESYVRQEDGPNSSKLLTSLKPYREDDDALLKAEKEGSRSLVPELFSSRSGTTQNSGHSLIPSPSYGRGSEGTTTEPENEPQISGWFQEDGTLDDAGRDTYLDTIATDHDDDIPLG